ncbi:MAG: DUF2007 domain-containing protein [Clostridiales Family XIII bacterium]|jgi:hypothetical protein|nr:DUF2007 domain-containing protein [Clostridiales Family XIII bacterium]
MFKNEKDENKQWRDGVYLCTANNSMEADILESKLRGEGIPGERRYKGAGNFLEIFMGSSSAYPIDIYVPESALEDAKNIIVAFPLLGDGPVDFDALSEEELAELVEEKDGEED